MKSFRIDQKVTCHSMGNRVAIPSNHRTSQVIQNDLGSGLIAHIQKIRVAAMQIAEKKVCAHLS